jgi:hypothetical protein
VAVLEEAHLVAVDLAVLVVAERTLILLLEQELLHKDLLEVNRDKVHLAAAAVELAKLVTLMVLVMVETV